MKPTLQINHNERGSCRDNATRRSDRKLLLTDYNYHPTPQSDMSSSASRSVTRSPAFHRLSSEFFGAETSLEYIAELLFFILITGIAAWPIVSMLIAVVRMIRNY